MKLLTKEEEDAHYRAVLKGGATGTLIGLAGGVAGVLAASRRYHTIRSLTLPMKAFLTTSSATFVGIVSADHASRRFEIERNADQQWLESVEEKRRREELLGLSATDRLFNFLHREKYKIVGATWVASMIGSFWLVSRNPYLSGQQKIVQARVYAQGLTLAVLVASAGFEIADQKRGKGILDATKAQKESAAGEFAGTPLTTGPAARDENADLWKDMVAAEEQRLKSQHKSLYEHHSEEEQKKKEEDTSEDEKKEDAPEPATENKK